MTQDLISLASQFGAPGLLIAFMIWDRTQQNALAKIRVEADLEMAKGLTLLAERVNHVR